MSVILQRLADTDERFDEYSDETCPLRPGELGEEHHDGHWLYTAPGWINPGSETHCIHEWTVKAVLAEVKDIVPCRCDDCLDLLGHKGAVIRTSDLVHEESVIASLNWFAPQQLHEGNQS